MSINASHIVSVTPSVLSINVSDLETNGMVLSQTELIPADQPAMVFGSAAAVSAYFGPEADETLFAQQYFQGINYANKMPTSLVIGRRVSAPAAAWIRSGAITATLAELKAVTDGALTVSVNGTPVGATNIDLSSATSFSQVAELVAAGIEGVTGSYSSVTNTFTFTTEATGDTAAIGFASAGTAGTDLSTMLGLTQAAGAVLSQGSAAMTPQENMNAIVGVTANFTQFTTIYEVEDEDEAMGLSAFADSEDGYCYVFWSSDKNMSSQLTWSSTLAYALKDAYNCTIPVYAESYITPASVIAYPACIKWDATQGMMVLFGKSASGVTPLVTTDAEAEALDTLGVTYIGQFATRNDQFIFANRGALTGDMYGFMDVLIGNIWLRSKLQTSIMAGFARAKRVPYNDSGYTLLRSWCQDPINDALRAGAIDTGIELSESQRAEILQQTGDEAAPGQLNTNGFYLLIQGPSAAVRAQRGSPIATLYYAYLGSVQKFDLPVTAVL